MAVLARREHTSAGRHRDTFPTSSHYCALFDKESAGLFVTNLQICTSPLLKSQYYVFLRYIVKFYTIMSPSIVIQMLLICLKRK